MRVGRERDRECAKGERGGTWREEEGEIGIDRERERKREKSRQSGGIESTFTYNVYSGLLHDRAAMALCWALSIYS